MLHFVRFEFMTLWHPHTHICRWTPYTCEVCGEKHSRWTISDPSRLQSYFKMAGAPYLPHFRIVNSRNIRAVFHRFNIKFNKGFMPPSDGPPPPEVEPKVKAPEPQAASQATGVAASKPGGDGEEDGVYDQEGFEDDDCQCNAMEEELARRRAELMRDDGVSEADRERYKDHSLGPDIWGHSHRRPMCCCQYRLMSAMELQTFWKVGKSFCPTEDRP